MRTNGHADGVCSDRVADPLAAAVLALLQANGLVPAEGRTRPMRLTPGGRARGALARVPEIDVVGTLADEITARPATTRPATAGTQSTRGAR